MCVCVSVYILATLFYNFLYNDHSDLPNTFFLYALVIISYSNYSKKKQIIKCI